MCCVCVCVCVCSLSLCSYKSAGFLSSLTFFCTVTIAVVTDSTVKQGVSMPENQDLIWLMAHDVPYNLQKIGFDITTWGNSPLDLCMPYMYMYMYMCLGCMAHACDAYRS